MADDFIWQYWEEQWRLESDWKPGSPVKFFDARDNLYSVGEVLESDPPNLLSYTSRGFRAGYILGPASGERGICWEDHEGPIIRT